ncbi:NfeD family protein [Cellulosimicrobium arenosum]|uniref:NfeD family protein n=1 Tax=Cellulosimicrobium arenosum TaxID=2708133 RepID=A0A927J1Y5_9MICO|nr:NfeD family protein [Cellulosimicrobium arenosum]MBD8080310.1 NfeD family protein [Cellulosimicrobium arenosum]
MFVFVVIGIAGLALLLVSLLVGEIVDIGDGAVSGTSLGVGGVVFGALGAIVTVNGLPTVLAYAGSLVAAVAVVLLVQVLVRKLRASEDGVAVSLVGVQGIATTDIDPARGEVSLEAARELERRLAWSDEPIPEGARVVVLEQSGSKVRVRRHFAND